MNTTQAQNFLNRGWSHLVIWDYDCDAYKKGDIVSKHKDLMQAERKANTDKTGHWKVLQLEDYSFIN